MTSLWGSAMIWCPVRGEDRLLNVVAAALVLLLLSLGFDILKLPAKLAPDRPPWPQFIGLCCLLVLNGIYMWTVARDDYLRTRRGLPRVAGTLVVFTIAASVAMLLRGLWEGTFVLNLNRPMDGRASLTVAIGGQITVMLFMSAFFIKKADSGPVREFKGADARAQAFLQAWLRGDMKNAGSLASAFQPVKSDLRTLEDKAASAVNLIDPSERQYPGDVVALFQKVSRSFNDLPEASLIGHASVFMSQNGDALGKVLGSKALRRLQETSRR